MNEKFILVVGSRSIKDYNILVNLMNKIELESVGKKLTIVSGGAEGVDALAKQYANDKNYKYIEFPADWDRYGKSAGFIRNEEMHKFISSKEDRLCLAIWDGVSKGTQHSLELCNKYNNKLILHNIGIENTVARKSVVSVKQIKYHLSQKTKELNWKVETKIDAMSLEDILIVISSLKSIKFYDKDELINTKLEEKCIYNFDRIVENNNGVLRIRIPKYKDKDGNETKKKNYNSWVQLLKTLRSVICNKTLESFTKEVHDKTFYSAGVVDIEDVNYTDYTIKNKYKHVVVETKELEALMFGRAYKYNMYDYVEGYGKFWVGWEIRHAKPIIEKVHQINFKIISGKDIFIINNSNYKKFMKVKFDLPYEDIIDIRHNTERKIWNIINFSNYSYKAIIINERLLLLLGLTDNMIKQSNNIGLIEKLNLINKFRETIKNDLNKAVIVAVDYLLDYKVDIRYFFDLELVEELADELNDESFGVQNLFESKVFDDSNYIDSDYILDVIGCEDDDWWYEEDEDEEDEENNDEEESE